MIKKILSHKFSQSFVGWIISIYIKVCYHTSFWNIKKNEAVETLIRNNKNFIVCFWHNRLLMAPFCWNYEKKFKMLISGHRDGKIISNAVFHLGIETISGSSNKNKMSSAKEILKEIKKNNIVGITPDGPRGPREKIKKGLISLLKKTNVPIVLLSYSAKFKISLKSWDKFVFVTPFNKFVAVWGNPIKFNMEKSLTKNMVKIEEELNRVSLLSDNLAK